MIKFQHWLRAGVLAALAAAPLLAPAQQYRYNLFDHPPGQARGRPNQAAPGAGTETVCNRRVGPLAAQQDTLLYWLPSGPRSVPDAALLRPGDGLVVRAESAREALDKIGSVKNKIRSQGANPEDYKYIVRTLPQFLAPAGHPAFFAGLSGNDLKDLQAQAFAIMFDHERAWFDRNPGVLPAWSWDYDWTLQQVRALSAGITANCIPAGVLVTPSARKEGRWTGRDGRLVANGFARLLDTRDSGLTYLIVQAQPRCREDESGRGYGQFARQLRQEVRTIFPGDPGKMRNLIMQVSLDDDVHDKKGANYVPPDWMAACVNSTAERGSEKVVNGFFLWSGSRKATCESIQRIRGGRKVVCED